MDFVDLPSVRFEKQRYDYAMVVVCRLSGYVIALPCEKDGLTGEKCASMFFRNVMSFAGLPKEITSDVDIRLMSTFFQTICQMSGVEQHNSTVYRPRSNGRAETAVRSVVSMLRKCLLELKSENWVEVLPIVLWGINAAPGVVSKHTPHELVFGRDAPGFGDEPALHMYKSSRAGTSWVNHMRLVRQEVAEKIEKIHQEKEKEFNAKFRPVSTFKVGDWVYVELRDNERNKLDPWFMGPCEVLRRVHDDTYMVSTPSGDKQYTFDKLRLYPKALGDRTPLYFYKPRLKEGGGSSAE